MSRSLLACFVAVLAFLGSTALSQGIDVFADYEVWIIDQSDSIADAGGTLYIYQGTDLTGTDGSRARAEVTDLGEPLATSVWLRPGAPLVVPT